MEGLTAGASIISGLVEHHWDSLYPMPDENGLETRVAAVAGLSGQGADGTLMQPLRKTPLFNRPDGTPFGLWQYQATLDLSGITDEQFARIHGPVGLNIGAKSPAEIAVSIMGQIVEVRARRLEELAGPKVVAA